jgi:tRNA threonylcarbamoyladenosine biosynthesis protein TsaB
VKVLGIDTATPRISVALVDAGPDGERVLGERELVVERNRTGLLVVLDELFAAAGLRPHEIDAVAVGAGPGSFTGLRIGMATAKGIAFAASRPLWAVSSLAALAHAELVRDPAGIVVGVLDARRGEVYAGAYRRDGARIELVGEERVLAPRDVPSLVQRAGEPVRYAGDARATYPDELAVLPGTWDVTPTGRAVAALALAGAHVDVLVGGAPSYIRPSEAEVKYPDGVPGALRKR